MMFLPEEDRDFLESNSIPYELLAEQLPDGNKRRGVLFAGLSFVGNLRMQQGNNWIACASCDVLVVIPDGYATTKLDSFYTSPRLTRPDGSDPQSTAAEQQLFQRNWQFWSRHLDDREWRVGIDGLRTYLGYIRAELRSA
jgi:hypothetical protein